MLTEGVTIDSAKTGTDRSFLRLNAYARIDANTEGRAMSPFKRCTHLCRIHSPAQGTYCSSVKANATFVASTHLSLSQGVLYIRSNMLTAGLS